MAIKRTSDIVFIESTIHAVAEIGIENTRTKDVAEHAGFSEASMFRRFPSKEILLRESFLYVDRQISDILTRNVSFRNLDGVPCELAMYAIWHKVYRYLIEHREETIFYIRYRYSSLYTDEVRNSCQAYNGTFDTAYELHEKKVSKASSTDWGIIFSSINEMTLGFAEKVITGTIKDSPETEESIWTAVSTALSAFSRLMTEKAAITDTVLC